MDNENKSIIELEHYNIGFIAPFDGFLYVQAEDFVLRYGDDYQIYVKKDLNRFYIDNGVLTFITNPKNLKSVKFLKIEDAPQPQKYVVDYSKNNDISDLIKDLKARLQKG